MPTKYTHPTLVINIKRRYFAEILSIPSRKDIEYRDLSPYWLSRLEKVGPAPFNLRLLNGMTPPVPEATVRVLKVDKDKRKGEIRLHLGRVLEVKHWDRKHEKPTR
jgi:hypothetical protein